MKLKKGKFLWAVLFFVLSLSSCKALRNKNALFTAKTDNITDTLLTVHSVNDKGEPDLIYRIQPTDELIIRNLQNTEFGVQSGVSSALTTAPSFYVESDGTVLLPVIGKIALAGLTRREARNKLQELYAQKLLKDPIIDLSIVNMKVSVLGEVKVQGLYSLERDNTTLTDIISQAGGLTPSADPKNVRIIRGEKSNPEIIYVNLKNINSLAHKKLILQKNDILYIEPKRSSVEAIQNSTTIIQPLVILLNVVTLIFTLSR